MHSLFEIAAFSHNCRKYFFSASEDLPKMANSNLTAKIPDAVMQLVIALLSCVDMITLRRVNRRWKRLINELCIDFETLKKIHAVAIPLIRFTNVQWNALPSHYCPEKTITNVQGFTLRLLYKHTGRYQTRIDSFHAMTGSVIYVDRIEVICQSDEEKLQRFVKVANKHLKERIVKHVGKAKHHWNKNNRINEYEREVHSRHLV